MNGILIIGHAPLATALRQCALHVFPECAAELGALDVLPNVPPEETLADAREVLRQLEQQAGIKSVLVLADVFGATPCNVAQKLVDGLRSRLVTGVNLPMLLRTVSYRSEALEALAARAVSGGTQGVMLVAALTPQNQSRRNHDPEHHHHQQ